MEYEDKIIRLESKVDALEKTIEHVKDLMREPELPEGYISARTLMATLGCSESTLVRWRRKGVPPSVRTNQGYMYSIRTLIEFFSRFDQPFCNGMMGKEIIGRLRCFMLGTMH